MYFKRLYLQQAKVPLSIHLQFFVPELIYLAINILGYMLYEVDHYWQDHISSSCFSFTYKADVKTDEKLAISLFCFTNGCKCYFFVFLVDFVFSKG